MVVKEVLTIKTTAKDTGTMIRKAMLMEDHPRGGQAKICGTYADLVGTENAGVQIFSMVLQIFSMMHLGKIFLIEMLLECSY